MEHTVLYMLLCVVLLIASVSGNSTSYDEVFKMRLSQALCHSTCRITRQISYEVYCQMDFCGCGNMIDTRIDMATESSEIDSPTLVCKGDNIGSFAWHSNDTYAYFVEIQDTENHTKYGPVTHCTQHTERNLMENTSYLVRLWSASKRENKLYKSAFLNFTTAKIEDYPLPVQDVDVELPEFTDQGYEALIKWIPGEDRSCFYHLYWFDEGMEEKEITDPTTLFATSVKHLMFNTNYSMHLLAKNSQGTRESPAKIFNVQIPSCIESFKSLENCVPDPPANLTVSEIHTKSPNHTESTVYDVEFSWEKPQLLPSFYIAHILNLDTVAENMTQRYMNISGDGTKGVFYNMVLGSQYELVLVAISPAGTGHPAVVRRHMTLQTSEEEEPDESLSVYSWFAIGCSTVTCFIAIGCAVFWFLKKRRAIMDRSHSNFIELEEMHPRERPEHDREGGADEWELPADIAATPSTESTDSKTQSRQLSVESILGEGEFGMVMKGRLRDEKGGSTPVAIKMLKGSPTQEDIRQFNHEIQIMKSVKRHPHIESLIGCITKNRPDNPLLVVEYCSRGNLQTYLRTAGWKPKINNNNQEASCFNLMYDFTDDAGKGNFLVKHLHSIGWQVAQGMEHLSKSNIVHRDLAARNVLVCEDRSVKVSDFGLSRDGIVYCKSSKGLVPLRWMAPESMLYQVYTTKSDVWSYGVLLWEIFTLGQTPYEGVTDLCYFLKYGGRLWCPKKTCSIDTYNVMMACWKESAQDRPSFSELAKIMERLVPLI